MDYAGLAARAVSQIADKGRAVSLVYKTQGQYSAHSDTFYQQGSSTQSVFAVIVEYSDRDIDETLIKSGDRLALIAPDDLDAEPSTADQVTDGDLTYSVVRVETIKPGDTVLLYKLQLRR